MVYRAARWWDAEVKAKIEHRRKIAGGQDELWEDILSYIIKLHIWNEVLEKANSDYDRKELWAFVSRIYRKRALRNNAGVSIKSTKGKLQILQSHYQDLGSNSVFDEDWKQEVESKDCSSMPGS